MRSGGLETYRDMIVLAARSLGSDYLPGHYMPSGSGNGMAFGI